MQTDRQTVNEVTPKTLRYNLLRLVEEYFAYRKQCLLRGRPSALLGTLFGKFYETGELPIHVGGVAGSVKNRRLSHQQS